MICANLVTAANTYMRLFSITSAGGQEKSALSCAQLVCVPDSRQRIPPHGGRHYSPRYPVRLSTRSLALLTQADDARAPCASSAQGTRTGHRPRFAMSVCCAECPSDVCFTPESRHRHVRFGSKADIGQPPSNVRFTPNSGHWNSGVKCPLCAKSGHLKPLASVQYRRA